MHTYDYLGAEIECMAVHWLDSFIESRASEDPGGFVPVLKVSQGEDTDSI